MTDYRKLVEEYGKKKGITVIAGPSDGKPNAVGVFYSRAEVIWVVYRTNDKGLMSVLDSALFEELGWERLASKLGLDFDLPADRPAFEVDKEEVIEENLNYLMGHMAGAGETKDGINVMTTAAIAAHTAAESAKNSVTARKDEPAPAEKPVMPEKPAAAAKPAVAVKPESGGMEELSTADIAAMLAAGVDPGIALAESSRSGIGMSGGRTSSGAQPPKAAEKLPEAPAPQKPSPEEVLKNAIGKKNPVGDRFFDAKDLEEYTKVERDTFVEIVDIVKARTPRLMDTRIFPDRDVKLAVGLGWYTDPADGEYVVYENGSDLKRMVLYKGISETAACRIFWESYADLEKRPETGAAPFTLPPEAFRALTPVTMKELVKNAEALNVDLTTAGCTIGSHSTRPHIYGVYADGDDFVVYDNVTEHSSREVYRGSDEQEACARLWRFITTRMSRPIKVEDKASQDFSARALDVIRDMAGDLRFFTSSDDDYYSGGMHFSGRRGSGILTDLAVNAIIDVTKSIIKK